MKIAVLAALYPTNSLGGAEDCARGFATWAAGAGHAVRVVTTEREEGATPKNDQGVEIVTIRAPHVLPITRVRKGSKWVKPLWHLQDHVSTEAAPQVLKALDDFAPDVVVVHYVQGFGYRLIERIATAGYPIAYVMHDLALACYRMAMFKGEHPCVGQCLPCKVSSAWKARIFDRAKRLTAIGILSPSVANMTRVGQYFPLDTFERQVVLNTKAYPTPRHPITPREDGTLRLFFAGKLHESKGVDLLLEAVEQIADTSGRAIRLNVAGGGPLDRVLRQRFGDRQWCRFLGVVDQQHLADEMVAADIVCIPSVVYENSPGVAVQALSIGVPVYATPSGGIVELVEDGRNGRLIEPTVTAWAAAFSNVITGQTDIAELRRGAQAGTGLFDVDHIGEQTVAFLQSIVDRAAAR